MERYSRPTLTRKGVLLALRGRRGPMRLAELKGLLAVAELRHERRLEAVLAGLEKDGAIRRWVGPEGAILVSAI